MFKKKLFKILKNSNTVNKKFVWCKSDVTTTQLMLS